MKITNEVFDIIYQDSPVAMELYDRKGILIKINKQVLDLFGVKPEVMDCLIGNYDLHTDPNYQDPITWEKLNKGEMVISEIIFDPKIVKYETHKKDKLHLCVVTTPISESISKDIGYIVRIIDITKSKISEQKLNTILKNLDEIVMQVNENAEIVYINKETPGLSNDKVIGTKIYQWVPESDYETVKKSFDKAFKDQEGSEYESMGPGPNGAMNYYKVNVTPIVIDDKVESAIYSTLDITDVKRALDERERLVNLEALSLLAGGIAHDFNNILTTILGRVSLLLGNTECDKHSIAKKDLISIEKAARNAVGLTKQLLTFAKGSSLEKESINIKKIIENIIKYTMSGSPIEIISNFTHTHSIFADPGQISQVIQNLIINAKQAISSKGVINILTEDYIYDGIEMVKVSISDNGSGIPNEILNKIFNPYFTTKQSGSGLGLSVCYSIIKKHGGHISVRSEIEKGTEFEIYLPKSDELVEEIEKEEIKIVRKRLNIAIMEDNADIRDMLSAYLKMLKHNFFVTTKGEELLDLIKSNNSIDLILMDLTIIGGMGGIETIQELRKFNTTIKVIATSGYAENFSMDKYYKYGFDGFLKKPYSKEELIKAINEHI